ncbi:MerR family transcriptional regulator [Massilia arenosa]|uniref:MerR family transcriptional regulator n=1 Tax=Zemynaea arenosa TaxID=2561931 RepID=A0A4Y9RQY5_9BURK|nr:MerR family transcriptional regulator [Massilia arenosa]TFW11303.1 MerR family transcriptional regulator [Massilia arenosa]
MNEFLTISELAAATGLTAHTLRYYERAGLVRAVGRAGSGHRRYSAADRAWIEFLQRLRTTGMGIAAMRHFADLRYQGESSVPQRRVLLEEHLEQVRAQMQSLAECERGLVEKLRHYRKLERNLGTIMAPQPHKDRTGHERTLRTRTRQTD